MRKIPKKFKIFNIFNSHNKAKYYIYNIIIKLFFKNIYYLYIEIIKTIFKYLKRLKN